MNWLDTYPHKIYASALLLEGMLYNWKVGQRHWENPTDSKMRFTDLDKINRMTIAYTCWEVKNDEEHNLVFAKYSKDWFKNWELHPSYLYGSPFEGKL